jgi:hypothetical protein
MADFRVYYSPNNKETCHANAMIVQYSRIDTSRKICETWFTGRSYESTKVRFITLIVYSALEYNACMNISSMKQQGFI